MARQRVKAICRDDTAVARPASVCVGSDAGATVMTDYKPPFAFAGTVKKGSGGCNRRGCRRHGGALAALAGEDAERPPVLIPFFAFRVMVGCGLLVRFRCNDID
jgi:cytochrome bd-type quinol oxidase subunit 1